MKNCIFCLIAKHEAWADILWEDKTHIAFLSIYPNTEGFSVVIPKFHQPSYVFACKDQVITDLMIATKKTAKMIEVAYPDVARCGVVFEGWGVNHLHTKLFPMHGTGSIKKWRKLSSAVDKYFTHYEGYISSHDYKRARDSELARVAEKIRQANKT